MQWLSFLFLLTTFRRSFFTARLRLSALLFHKVGILDIEDLASFLVGLVGHGDSGAPWFR